MPSTLEDLLLRTITFLEKEGIEYMVIGGFALPSYGPIRTTLDLDVAVRINGNKKFDSFVEAAKKSGFEPGVASFSNPVNLFRDERTGLEVEFWLSPDGIEWDTETLRRRRRTKIGSVGVWLVSPEDFIVSKLSRPDRGVQDEKDVKGVLARLGDSVDRTYLVLRAGKAGVLALLRAIEVAQ
ncbi:MAG: nucleotidyltransferase [Nitrososphaerales archaeon]|nr:nucleotidyltransferase [Nitrososphaerales archaeon]